VPLPRCAADIEYKNKACTGQDDLRPFIGVKGVRSQGPTSSVARASRPAAVPADAEIGDAAR